MVATNSRNAWIINIFRLPELFNNYGEKCAAYLFGDKFVVFYRITYTATVMLGTVLTLDIVWTFADIFNGLMALPNLIALLLLSKVVVSETRDFIARRKSGELY